MHIYIKGTVARISVYYNKQNDDAYDDGDDDGDDDDDF